MKVYSWNYLLQALFFAGFFGWVGIRQLDENWRMTLLYFVLGVVMLVRGLWEALTERGFRRTKQRERLDKLAQERRFGRYKTVVLWSGVVVLLASMLLSLQFSVFFFITLALMVVTLIYYLVVAILLKTAREEIELEEYARGEREAS